MLSKRCPKGKYISILKSHRVANTCFFYHVRNELCEAQIALTGKA